jgi:hyperosmotically inducible periplasmic protein
MRPNILFGALLAMFVFGTLSGCSTTEKSPDVTNQIRNALDQAGLKDVNVKQDRDKGVVTLTGTTASDADKAQAESITKSIAANDIVADEIAVRPPGQESMAKDTDADLDKAIEKNFDAVLVQHKLEHDVKYDVKSGVITLTGNVRSQAQRKGVEKLAAGVPNVKQVVNEIEVNNQKASSSD